MLNTLRGAGIKILASGRMLLPALLMLMLLAPCMAWADDPPQQANFCTYNPQYDIAVPAPGTGIITLLVSNISNIVNNMSQGLYTAILADHGFQLAVRATMTLYVIIYGILFVFGMLQSVFMEFIMRVIKIGIVAALLAPNSWTFFYNIVGQFFQGGMNWLIGVMSAIAVGSVAGADPNYPFATLDNAIAALTSTKMFVTLIATFSTGPYGIIIGGLILMALVMFAKAVFQAMWVYLMALVVISFLFALAPIFFAFLLFQRTRNLFDGWLNQLASAVAQPVFMFAFFAFFTQLVAAAMMNLLVVPVCYMPSGETLAGSPVTSEWWRFMVPCMVNGSERWMPTSTGWGPLGPNIQNCGAVNMPVFPLDIVNVLIFIGLCFIMSSFVSVAPHLAREIFSGGLDLNVSSGIEKFLSPLGSRLGSLQSAARSAGGAAPAGSGNANRGFMEQMGDLLGGLGGRGGGGGGGGGGGAGGGGAGGPPGGAGGPGGGRRPPGGGA